jgi:peptide chain release factor subunit 1
VIDSTLVRGFAHLSNGQPRRVESARFSRLLDTPGPFTSVYFEDSPDTNDAGTQPDLKWPAVRVQLEAQGADEAVTDHIEQALLDGRPPVGRRGRAVVASATGILIDEHLLQPTSAPVVRVSELPYIVPILELGYHRHNYMLVLVDHEGADITVRDDGQLRSETVDGGGAVADRVSELADDPALGTVFVVGEVRSRADLLAALPERVGEQAVPLSVGGRHSGHDAGEVQLAIEATLRRQRLSAIDDAAERFTAEIGRESGRAVEGLGPVCVALRRRDVEMLIIGDMKDATVVADDALTNVAPNADALSDQGAAAVRTLRADEALPLLAISAGASLVRTDERIAPADGIGAVLRYVPAPQPPSRR